ncbi:hypothetical protein [Pseudomonas sp. GM78]|uniref:hypothetical protein n=1 Tax=Pseudomonas sp. GM78 TaxID=1144337 RepID=UPI001EE664CF|nr:hypothetical protein [Pseudomonas sp. GM78]
MATPDVLVSEPSFALVTVLLKGASLKLRKGIACHPWAIRFARAVGGSDIGSIKIAASIVANQNSYRKKNVKKSKVRTSLEEGGFSRSVKKPTSLSERKPTRHPTQQRARSKQQPSQQICSLAAFHGLPPTHSP